MGENNMEKNGGEKNEKRGAGAHGMRCALQQQIKRNGDNL